MWESSYLWWKVIHVVSIVTWMAGLFYLPRLFVYHAMASRDTEHYRTLQLMERRLLRSIMHPSLGAVLVTGTIMLPAWLESGWMIAKLGLVSILVVFHVLCAHWQVAFEYDRNIHSHIFYRIINEIPTLILVGISILVIIKPF